jgi:Mn-dependent DtxR family transcriptional regulator/predicted transcriptional regulator
MPAKAPKVTLTCSQAACLIALRHGKYSKTTVAIEAKLDLIETSVALAVLARLGLACENTEERTWHATPRGKACRYQLSAERPHRKRGAPRGSGWRLLALLDRPRRGKEIAEKLGLSPQRVHQLVVKLHARGYLSVADPEHPLWLVMRAGDKTRLLSREEERVLSAVPREYVTDATKIRLAVGMANDVVEKTLESLLAAKLVESFEGLRGRQVYRMTLVGLNHPQRAPSARTAEEPRLPVESERVRNVLSAIARAGTLRGRDVAAMLQIPRQSLNALMQYLKRKHMVEKAGRELYAPYSLTDTGRMALGEMTRRQAA